MHRLFRNRCVRGCSSEILARPPEDAGEDASTRDRGRTPQPQPPARAEARILHLERAMHRSNGHRHVDEVDAPADTGCSPLSRSAVVDLAGLRMGDVVVAVGCGGCRDAAKIAQSVGPAGRAILLDASGESLQPPWKAAHAPPWARLLVRGDAAAMGLRSSVADVVVVNCAMHDRLDRAAVYAEIHRVLKPGGRLVVSDEVVATSRGAYGAPRAALDRVTITEPECLATVRAAGFDRVTLLQRTAPYEVHGRIVLSLTLQATRAAGGI